MTTRTRTDRSVDPAPSPTEVAHDLGVLVASYTHLFPLPGEGRTLARFDALRTFGHHDLSLARLAEGHFDACAVLAEANTPAPDEGRLGVWAAGPIGELHATRAEGGWRLEGIRRWCSGAEVLSHAVVTAQADDGDRLFLVPLDTAGVLPDPSTWPAVGMAGSGTLDVTFDGVELDASSAIGPPGFYLDRPGFWVGGIGVAALWLGAAEAVAQTLRDRAGNDPHRLAHLGAVTGRLHTLGVLLEDSARRVDDLLRPSGDRAMCERHAAELERLARIVRTEIADGATEVLQRTGRATGADPLGHDGTHARRVADLTVYLRQHHAERDLAALGAIELRT